MGRGNHIKCDGNCGRKEDINTQSGLLGMPDGWATVPNPHYRSDIIGPGCSPWLYFCPECYKKYTPPKPNMGNPDDLLAILRRNKARKLEGGAKGSDTEEHF